MSGNIPEIQRFAEFAAALLSEGEKNDALAIQHREIIRLRADKAELVEALEQAKLGLEAMVEAERCGEAFVATALTIDKAAAVLNKHKESSNE